MKKHYRMIMPLMLAAALSFPVSGQSENETFKLLNRNAASSAMPIENPENADDGAILPSASVEEQFEPTGDPAETSEKTPVTDATIDTDTDESTTIEPESTDELNTRLTESEPVPESNLKADSADELEAREEPEPELELEPEPAEPDPFAREPYAQSSLKDIEKYIENSHELAEKSKKFNERTLAIIAGSSDNRNFRRHCEFLSRVSNHNIYSVSMALIVFPRLLEVSNLVCENSIRTLMNTFADELIREPLAREIRLSELHNHIDSQAKLVKLLRQVANNIDLFCQQARQQSSRRHIQGNIPEFLRATNHEMLKLIQAQRQQLDMLLNQCELHQRFCQINIDYFLAVSDAAPAVMQGSQLGRILRSCLDFAVTLGNYRNGYEIFSYQFGKLIENRLTDGESLIGRDSRRAARIDEFVDNFPERDRDEAHEASFTAEYELQQAFALLDHIYEQSKQLRHDETSAASDEQSQTDSETFNMLKAELTRHLNSANWPITKPEIFDDFERELASPTQ